MHRQKPNLDLPGNGQVPPRGLEPTTDRELHEALGQTLHAALDLERWAKDAGLESLFTRAGNFVSSTAQKEKDWRSNIRREVLERLEDLPNAPAAAGVYKVSEDQLRHAYRNHLLCGEVAAVNGASAGHDGLAASLVAIGVSLVRYDGRMNSWQASFFRDDFPVRAVDPVESIKEFLNRRHARSSPAHRADMDIDRVTSLLRRGIMAASERKALLEKAAVRWRMGHGIPAPLELLTGSGSPALIDEALPILERLLLQDNRWIFLPTPWSNRALSTLANALDDGQIAIFQKGIASLDEIVNRGHIPPGYHDKIEEFANRLGEVMVIGGFRATPHASGQVFVAHAEHALAAGVLAMADASLQPHRGFPLLLDLAEKHAKFALGLDEFHGVVESAYAKIGAGHLYAKERIMI